MFRDRAGRESRKIRKFRKIQDRRNQFKILKTVNKYVFDPAEFKKNFEIFVTQPGRSLHMFHKSQLICRLTTTFICLVKSKKSFK